jgi:hypothetical protein
MNWGTELLRLTLFASEQLQASDHDWTAITGQSESETRHTNPNGGRLYVGKHRETQLAINSLGQRLDVVQSVYPSSVTEGTNAHTIGDWKRTREVFVEDTAPWLASVRYPVVRIAFSCVLLAEAADRMAAYQALKTVLKSVQVDPAEMRDLIFRVNWPQKSTAAPGLQVNRITHWSAIRLHRVLVQVGGADASVAHGVTSHFVRLEVDHNTDEARKSPFAQDEMVTIYKELVELANENAERGERP